MTNARVIFLPVPNGMALEASVATEDLPDDSPFFQCHRVTLPTDLRSLLEMAVPASAHARLAMDCGFVRMRGNCGRDVLSVSANRR